LRPQNLFSLNMDWLLYIVASGLVGVLQAFPVTWVAHFGRCVGGLAYWLDARHRRVAIRNLTLCFGKEKSLAEIHALAHENFRRIGESFASAIKTSSMSPDRLRDHMQIVGVKKILPKSETEKPTSRVFAIGHFGNFELFAHAYTAAPWYRCATTYRALRGEALNRVLLRLRERTGCLYFERRTEGAALRAATRNKHLMLGLLSDQHSGDHGLRLPFFGHDCTTTKAPAVFALRFNLPLHTAFCFRTRPGHWRIEVGDEIPIREHGELRSVEAIMRDVNRAFEEAVRRDPANWFWVHNRWKVRRKAPAPVATETVSALVPSDGGEDQLAEGE
jgi:lauroyl/myristoyl acyltransferase